jgi:hypothetical protein
MCEPDGRRPGRALTKQTRGIGIAPNGRQYARFGRASASPNLAEWSERMRAERGPMSATILGFQYIARRARTVLLGEGLAPS